MVLSKSCAQKDNKIRNERQVCRMLCINIIRHCTGHVRRGTIRYLIHPIVVEISESPFTDEICGTIPPSLMVV